MMNFTIPLPYIEIFVNRVLSEKKFRSYFLYQNKPTNWRENWRNISGFYIRGLGGSLMVCVWRQHGVYTDRQHRDIA